MISSPIGQTSRESMSHSRNTPWLCRLFCQNDWSSGNGGTLAYKAWMEEALPGSLPRHAGLYSLYSLDSLDTFTSFTDKQIRSNEQLDARVARVWQRCQVLSSWLRIASVQQVALISFARDVLGIADATSEEFDSFKTSGSYIFLHCVTMASSLQWLSNVLAVA